MVLARSSVWAARCGTRPCDAPRTRGLRKKLGPHSEGRDAVARDTEDWMAAGQDPTNRQTPVLLFDVMDTIVYDPFYVEVPKFFGTTLEELFEIKHPTLWSRFEKGEIPQEEMLEGFFTDGRSYDKQGLMQTMLDGYRYLDGMEALLQRLNAMAYELHTMSNYPEWYKLIDHKLGLSRYLSWTFVSCTGAMKGLRKPDLDAFQSVVKSLGCSASDILLVDDRENNVKAARRCGIDGILFENAIQLENELRARGMVL